MSQQFCPECGGELFYDAPVRRYACKSCGLYVTKDEIQTLKEKDRGFGEDEQRRKKREQAEYLEWWLGKKQRAT